MPAGLMILWMGNESINRGASFFDSTQRGRSGEPHLLADLVGGRPRTVSVVGGEVPLSRAEEGRLPLSPKAGKNGG